MVQVNRRVNLDGVVCIHRQVRRRMAMESRFEVRARGRQGSLACVFERPRDAEGPETKGEVRFEATRRGFRVGAEDLLGVEAMGDARARLWRIERVKKGPVWKAKMQVMPQLTFQDAKEAKQAVEAIRRVATGTQMGSREVLVLVNPCAGKRRGMRLWQKKVLPVFRRSGIAHRIVETKAKGHAKDVASTLNLDEIGLVMTIGGDGTVFEVLQGLCGRSDWEKACKVALCPVPAGSGNALSASAGLFDPTTAAIAACKGVVQPLDVCSVIQPPRRFFSFLSTTFGLIANLDVGTEHLRWMGDARFTVGAVKEILGNKVYAGKAWLWPAEAELKAGHPTAVPYYLQHGPPCPIFCSSMDVAGETTLSQGPSGRSWRKLDDDFSLFILCNIPYISLDVKMAPLTSLGNSSFNVVHCGNISKGKRLQFLNSSGGHSERHISLPFVGNENARAMYLDPTPAEHPTWLVVDGEEVPFEPVFVESHPKLARVVVFPHTIG